MESIFHAKHVRLEVEQDWDGEDPYELEQPHIDPVVLRTLPEIFRGAVLRDIEDTSRPRTPAWLRKWAGIEQDLLCVYCGTALFIGKPVPGKRVANADALVPHALGGPLRAADNAVLCCASCKHEKGIADWVAMGKAASDALLAVLRKKRHAALLRSLNHVLPLTVHKESVGLAMLEKRWVEPRVKVYAGVYKNAGYFAWNPRALPVVRNGDLALQLRHGFGGRSLGFDDVALFEVPRATWFSAAWDFIEQNSLLVSLDMTFAERATYRRHTEERVQEHEERWYVTLPAQRWLQEVRRVTRWATQAKPVRREVVREQAKAKRQAILDERLAVVKGTIGGVML